jgi:hypothetical protein
MTQYHPGEAEDDDRGDHLDDPASSHGSDLDPRIGDDEDEPDQGGEPQ